MGKWIKHTAMIALIACFGGGGVAEAAVQHANTSASVEFPVSNWSQKLAQHAVAVGVQGRAWHILKKVPIDAQVQEVTAHVALIDVFAPASGAWPAGLDLLNLATGKLKNVVRVPAGEDTPAAATAGNWVVYEDGRTGSDSYRMIVGHNVLTGKSYPIFKLPRQTYSAGNVQGLTIHGTRAYWLSNLLTPSGLVSRVYRDNLGTGQFKILAQVNDSRQHRLMLAMTAGPNGLWVSVAATGTVAAHQPGALWYLPWTGDTFTTRVSVWHAPTLLYGATNAAVVFSADYGPRPSSSTNPPPFPVYADEVARHRVLQLTERVAPGRAGTVAGAWLSINAMGDKSLIVNLETMRDVILPFPQAVVGKDWVVLRGPSLIAWARLNAVTASR
ncbi:MAG: hypothetical protein C7B45_11230 [Sulfobacillus acidophilus]|uniref:Uncharacterized protein n=1 Tax=Sulfobacillus acidophilus TaxID=53633 RepID=A0A2T2WGI9_9FIRM|nr:MAG: hypothetical protein C7B45_11230 [Sulfobacillus acidophilus]